MKNEDQKQLYIDELKNEINDLEKQLANLEDHVDDLSVYNSIYNAILNENTDPIIITLNELVLITNKAARVLLQVNTNDHLSKIFNEYTLVKLKIMLQNDIKNKSLTINNKNGKFFHIKKIQQFTKKNYTYSCFWFAEGKHDELFNAISDQTLNFIKEATVVLDQNHHIVYLNEHAKTLSEFTAISNELSLKFTIDNIMVLINEIKTKISQYNSWSDFIIFFNQFVRFEYELNIKIINYAEKIYYLCIFMKNENNNKNLFKTNNLSLFDGLTKLPNRTFATNYLKNYIAKGSKKIVVFFIDVDEFKWINDNFGHKTGDYVLHTIGQRLVSCLRDNDFVARIGGDEFLVVLSRLHGKKNIELLANKLLNTVCSTLYYQEHKVKAAISIGIAIYPHDTDKAEDLIDKSDYAMYYAKNHGKKRYAFYNDEMGKMQKNRDYYLLALRDILHTPKQHIKIKYQAIFNNTSGAVPPKPTMYECLARFFHKDEQLHTGQFIVLAEKEGYIILLGAHILEIIFYEIAKMLKKNKELHFSINLSTIQILDDNVFSFSFFEKIKQHHIPPDHISIEITETAAAENIDTLKIIMSKFLKKKITFYLDDFGIGYTSLSEFFQLPLKVIKLDKIFIDDLIKNKNVKMIVKKIISICKVLGYEIIAEGVEHKEQMDWLYNNGVKFSQGFLYYRPVSCEKIK